MDNKCFLEGIKISGYRSFSDEVTFDNLSKINFVIGQNNSGKSNLLRFLSKHYPSIKENAFYSYIETSYDKPQNHKNLKTKFSIKISGFGDFSQKMRSKYDSFQGDFFIQNLFYGRQNLWFEFEAINTGEKYYEFREIPTETFIEHNKAINIAPIIDFLEKINDKRYPRDRNKLFEAVRDFIRPDKFFVTNSELIPATRSLQISGMTDRPNKIHSRIYDYFVKCRKNSGFGLISELHDIKEPPIGQESLQERFNNIKNFLAEILDRDDLLIEIPPSRSEIIMRMDGKRVSLEDLGSGIEQLLILISQATLHRNSIICIEEPELHLHPSLQKKLIQYLAQKTDNQYFIATHSAHILDAVPEMTSIYHVELVHGYSKVTETITDQEKFLACSDLGYKPSDLMQCNYVLWVEGPTDRTYINHWLKSRDDSLIEGVHYSIMFYGGRLLSHLSVNDEKALEDFIMLQKISQNAGIVIDSDKSKKGGRLNSTKTRVKKEFIDRKGFVWVTQGREIENYISSFLLKKVLDEKFQSSYILPNDLEYSKITECKLDKTTKPKIVDKVWLARQIVNQRADFSVLDLEKRINDLVKAIRLANLLN